MKNLFEKIVKVLNEIPNTPTRFGSTYELASEVQKSINENQVDCIVVFGDNLIRSIAEGEKLTSLDETGGCFIQKSFASKAEYDAYIEALEDHEGWFGSTILDEQDKAKYSKVIGS